MSLFSTATKLRMKSPSESNTMLSVFFLWAQLKIFSTCPHTKFSSLQDFEMHYNPVWSSHWITNTLLQCKCLKTRQELKMRSTCTSLVCTLCEAASLMLQTATSNDYSMVQCHLITAPGRMRQQWSLCWTHKAARPRAGSRTKSRGEGLYKKRELLLSTKAPFGNYHPAFISAAYTCFFLPGAVLMAPLTIRADTFPTTENTKEAEILSITWR